MNGMHLVLFKSGQVSPIYTLNEKENIMSKTTSGYQSITSKAMKAEMLEQELELELARNWHQRGCEKSLHRLVNAYMRLAVSMASKYVKYGIDTNELIQEAGIGLMKAVLHICPGESGTLVRF